MIEKIKILFNIARFNNIPGFSYLSVIFCFEGSFYLALWDACSIRGFKIILIFLNPVLPGMPYKIPLYMLSLQSF